MSRQKRRRNTSESNGSRGFMLLGLLIVLALGGISLMAAVDVWTLQRQREREEQLIFVGDEYRQAIRRYYFAAPNGTPRTLPTTLESLLQDDRYPIPVRHLRKLYHDPITGQTEWGEVRVGDRIAGVYSLSEAQPIKQTGFLPIYESFTGSTSYRDWIFSFKGTGRAPVTQSDGDVKASAIPSFSSRSVSGNSK